jgi:hypothetical protein
MRSLSYRRITAGEYKTQIGPVVATIEKCAADSAAPGMWYAFVTRTSMVAGEHHVAAVLSMTYPTLADAKADIVRRLEAGRL